MFIYTYIHINSVQSRNELGCGHPGTGRGKKDTDHVFDKWTNIHVIKFDVFKFKKAVISKKNYKGKRDRMYLFKTQQRLKR